MTLTVDLSAPPPHALYGFKDPQTGTFTAYPVSPAMRQWLSQRFMGSPASDGVILSQGDQRNLLNRFSFTPTDLGNGDQSRQKRALRTATTLMDARANGQDTAYLERDLHAYANEVTHGGLQDFLRWALVS
jgi:hypothetical protein